MANPQLLDYVRQQLTTGVSEEEIRKALAGQQWSEQEVTGAFAVVKLEGLQQIPPAIVPSPDVQSGISGASTMWTKTIPRTNSVFMVVTLGLVLGLDLVILIQSPSLFAFWAEMFGVLIFSLIFFWYENFKLKKKFGTSSWKHDGWIYFLVILRNITIVLNSIPLIQILGAMALVVGIIPYLIVYSLLLKARSNSISVTQ